MLEQETTQKMDPYWSHNRESSDVAVALMSASGPRMPLIIETCQRQACDMTSQRLGGVSPHPLTETRIWGHHVKGNRRLRSLPGVASDRGEVEGRVFGPKGGRGRALRTPRLPTFPTSRPDVDQSEAPRDDLTTSLPDDEADAQASSETRSSGFRLAGKGPIGWHQVGLHICDVLDR